eukprot:TRINITY_DN4320_c0_g1_i2.p1 TRINITY_DN4320_c0_g1~~TRINITY_DN4320_c0_g1_i2.p1  ORF type:complete len:1649 (+),score=817.75 TRINITY_DN4320_c0_g1_i2:111-5057(+)
MAEEEGWVKQQRKAFTGWCNGNLKRSDMKIETFEADLESGVILWQLLANISGKEPTRLDSKQPKTRFQKVGNLTACFKFLESEKVKIVNIGPEDIMSGNGKLILGLIWCLIRRYHLGATNESSASKELMEWVNSVIAPTSIRDFKKSFADGKAICALVNYKIPGTFDIDSINESNAAENMTKAFQIAEEKLSFPVLLDADLLISNPDDLSIMTYVSYFKEHKSAVPEKKPAASATGISGRLLDNPNSPVAPGDTVSFTLQANYEDKTAHNKGGDKINVTFTDKSTGNSAEISTKIQDNGDGTYTVSWEPNQEGDFVPNITFNDLPTGIQLEPVSVKRVSKGVDPKKSTLKFQGNLADVPRGKIARAVLSAKDTDGFPLEGLSTSIQLEISGIPQAVQVETKNPGEYEISFSPEKEGTHQLGAKLSGVQLEDHVTIHVTSTVDPSKSTAFNGELKTLVGTVGTPLEFSVQCRNDSGETVSTAGIPISVKMTHRSPTGKEEEVAGNVKDNGNGTFSVNYTPQAEGELKIQVEVEGHPIKGSPFPVKIFSGSHWDHECRAQILQVEDKLKIQETETFNLKNDLETEKKSRQDFNSEVESKLNSLDQEKSKLNSQVENLEKNTNDLRSENFKLKEELKSGAGNFAEKLSQLEEEVKQKSTQVEEKNAEIERNSKENSEKSKLLENFQVEISEKDKIIQELRGENREKTETIEKHNREISEKSHQISAGNVQVESNLKELENLKKEIQDKTKQADEYQKSNEEKTVQVENFKKSVEEKSLQLEKTQKDIEEKSEKIHQVETELKEQKERAEKTHKEQASLLDALNKRLESLFNKYEDILHSRDDEEDGKEDAHERVKLEKVPSLQEVSLDHPEHYIQLAIQYIERAEAQTKRLDTVLSHANSSIKKSRAKLTSSKHHHDQLQSQIAILEKQLKSLKDEKDSNLNQYEELMSKQKEWALLRSSLEDTITSLKDQLSDAGIYQQRVDELSNDLAKSKDAEQHVLLLTAELEKMRADLEKQKEVAMQATTLVITLLGNMGEMEAQILELKSGQDAMSQQLLELTLKLPFYQRHGFDDVPAPVGHVTLVFTDVQGSTTQWEMHPEVMAQSLQIHNHLMRMKIGEFRGYEVKTEGDAFMIAFADVMDATKWCLSVQQALLKAEWPEACYIHPDAKEAHDDVGNLIFRGLRVRMGIHVGDPSCEEDPVTKRMDYFGPMVNRSARVEGVAQGGQIIISGNVWDEIKTKLDDLGNPVVRPLGKFQLKGLNEETTLTQILPLTLAGRKFPDLAPSKQDEENEKKFKTLEDELNKIKEENEALGNQFAQIQSLLESAKAKVAEFVSMLKEAGGDEFGSALSDLDNMMKSQDEAKNKMAQVKATTAAAIKTVNSGDPDREKKLQALIDKLRSENGDLRDKLKSSLSTVQLLNCSGLATELQTRLGFIHDHTHRVEQMQKQLIEDTVEPARQEYDQLEKLKQEVNDLKSQFVGIDHNHAPIVKTTEQGEAKINQLQEVLVKRIGDPVPAPVETPTPPTPKKLPKPVEGDAIDELLVQACADINVDFRKISRISEGVYMVGSKRVNMKILSGFLVVRVGGGFMKFVEWLEKYGRKEGVLISGTPQKGVGTHVRSGNSVGVIGSPSTSSPRAKSSAEKRNTPTPTKK